MKTHNYKLNYELMYQFRIEPLLTLTNIEMTILLCFIGSFGIKKTELSRCKMENRELKLEHLDPLKWLRPPFVRDQCQERRWNIQEKEMSLTVISTEIQSFSLALMTNCWFSTAARSFQNFNCFGHSPRGCLEAILYECCCTQYLKLFSDSYT